MYGGCMPTNFYAGIRWRQKLEAAGFVVAETPWTHTVVCEPSRAIALQRGPGTLLLRDLPARSSP